MDSLSADARTFIQVHDGLPDHPKLADVDDDAAAFLLVALWCYCSRYSTDGRIPKALAHRMTKGASKARCDKLVKAGLLHDQGQEYEAHDYLKHQRSGAQIAAIRQRNASNGRAGGLAKSKRGASESLGESLSETPSPAVAEVRGHRSEQEPPYPPAATPPAPPKPPRRKPKTAKPDDWQPTAGDTKWARGEGWPDDAARAQTALFIANALSTDRRLTDWSQGWKGWLLKAVEWNNGAIPTTARTLTTAAPAAPVRPKCAHCKVPLHDRPAHVDEPDLPPLFGPSGPWCRGEHGQPHVALGEAS